MMISLAPSPQKLIKLGSFDVFLYKTKEYSRKKRHSALQTEILIIKVDHSSGWEI